MSKRCKSLSTVVAMWTCGKVMMMMTRMRMRGKWHLSSCLYFQKVLQEVDFSDGKHLDSTVVERMKMSEMFVGEKNKTKRKQGLRFWWSSSRFLFYESRYPVMADIWFLQARSNERGVDRRENVIIRLPPEGPESQGVRVVKAFVLSWGEGSWVFNHPVLNESV